MKLFPDHDTAPSSISEQGFPEKALLCEKKAFLLGAAAIAVGLYLSSLYNYLLFHSLVETYRVSIAFAIFMVAWNSRHYGNNPYLIVIGTAFVCVGFLDILHMLSYSGMAIFEAGDRHASQAWIAARYVESISLVAAVFALRREKRMDPYLLLTLSTGPSFRRGSSTPTLTCSGN